MQGVTKGGYYDRFGKETLSKNLIDEVQSKNKETVANMICGICYSDVKDNEQGTPAIGKFIMSGKSKAFNHEPDGTWKINLRTISYSIHHEK